MPVAVTPTWGQWLLGLQSDLGFNLGNNAQSVLYGWTREEKGSNLTQWNNPLNTTLRASGSSSVNSVGVQQYPTIQGGAAATAQTLQAYPNILAMLRSNTPPSQWTPAAKNELDTWAHGPNGDHSWRYANAVLGSSGTPPGGIETNTSGNSPLDNLNPLSGLGNAITQAEGNFANTATYFLTILIGAALMVGGVALLAVMAFAATPAPVKDVAAGAASLTPQGRAVGVARAATSKTQQKPNSAPTPAARSPQAQSAIAAAKAGRGSKLSPEVKQELRRSA